MNICTITSYPILLSFITLLFIWSCYRSTGSHEMTHLVSLMTVPQSYVTYTQSINKIKLKKKKEMRNIKGVSEIENANECKMCKKATVDKWSNTQNNI